MLPVTHCFINGELSSEIMMGDLMAEISCNLPPSLQSNENITIAIGGLDKTFISNAVSIEVFPMPEIYGVRLQRSSFGYFLVVSGDWSPSCLLSQQSVTCSYGETNLAGSFSSTEIFCQFFESIPTHIVSASHSGVSAFENHSVVQLDIHHSDSLHPPAALCDGRRCTYLNQSVSRDLTSIVVQADNNISIAYGNASVNVLISSDVQLPNLVYELEVRLGFGSAFTRPYTFRHLAVILADYSDQSMPSELPTPVPAPTPPSPKPTPAPAPTPNMPHDMPNMGMRRRLVDSEGGIEEDVLTAVSPPLMESIKTMGGILNAHVITFPTVHSAISILVAGGDERFMINLIQTAGHITGT